MLICAASSASLRLSSLTMAERSARRRSCITALSSSSGMDAKMRQSWMDSALSAGVLATKGPSRSTARGSRATRPPRRRWSSRSSRSARRPRPGMGGAHRAAPRFLPVQTPATRRSARRPRAARCPGRRSLRACGETRAEQRSGRRVHVTIRGIRSVSSASTLPKNRERQSCQVRALAPATDDGHDGGDRGSPRQRRRRSSRRRRPRRGASCRTAVAPGEAANAGGADQGLRAVAHEVENVRDRHAVGELDGEVGRKRGEQQHRPRPRRRQDNAASTIELGGHRIETGDGGF